MLPHRRTSLSCLFVYLFINNSELQVTSIAHADIVLSNLFLLRHSPAEPGCISCQNRADPHCGFRDEAGSSSPFCLP